MNNPCVTKSIASNGIVKAFLKTGLFHVETLDFDSPIGPRIEQGLRRYRFETGADLTWRELGQRVWARLGRGEVDTSKVSRIKKGAQQPSVAEGGAFAYELDVSPVWLFWEIGEMGHFPMPREVPRERTAPLQRGKRRPANRVNGLHPLPVAAATPVRVTSSAPLFSSESAASTEMFRMKRVGVEGPRVSSETFGPPDVITFGPIV
jgi:hypothetical protein